MNVPMSWIKEYVDLTCDTKTFADALTMSGSNVETCELLGSEISGVVVGKILSIDKHPDADKLVITQIDVGSGRPLQIVTGATNVLEGQFVPVALDGATLSQGIKIKKGKLRGEVSEGMLCSIEELGYTRHDYPESPEDGIYILQQAHPLGADVRPILELCDEVVEFELTSDRSDCVSILGMAREAAATFNLPFKYPNVTVEEKAGGDCHEFVSVDIQNADLCPRYIARVVKNIKIEPSPQWLRHRLTASGVRPINNIVDITNYVMLEFGQPMHAFDIDNIALDSHNERKIIVRNAKEGETFTTLDGVERELDPSMLVIADTTKAVAIAGVMGGENSKVTENATAILFESANFKGSNIRVTSRKLGLRTDASGKYEKGIDPNLAEEAVNRAVQLVELLCCGETVKGMVDCYPNKREPWTVTYCPDRINRLLGTNIPADDMVDYLNRVGIQSENNVACIPTFRPDVQRDVDIAEEVARLFGYNNIPATLATGTPTVGKKNFKQIVEDMIKNTMVSYGLYEALHYSFEGPKIFDKLNIPENDPLRGAIMIKNPLGEDFSVMRTTTLNGILQSLSTNYNRRNPEAALFELSKVYLPKSLPVTELPNEVEMLTIGLYGGNQDFYSLKGIVEKLFAALGIVGVDYLPEKELPFMHPGRCAVMMLDGESMGYLGEIHPTVGSNYAIDAKVYLASIRADLLYQKASLQHAYKPLPKFPGMQRDIAMLVKDETPVRDIEKAIAEKGGKLFQRAALFDVYRGQQIQEGYKSVAYSIYFQANDRTLTEEDVNEVMKKILGNLEEKVGAQLRDK